MEPSVSPAKDDRYYIWKTRGTYQVFDKHNDFEPVGEFKTRRKAENFVTRRIKDAD